MTAWTQLLSVGLVWISFHCAGMCGPLVTGFDVAGAARGLPAWRGVLRILTYQAGRATTLATLGALAALAGRGLEAVFQPAGAVFALLFGAAVLASVVRKLWPRRAAEGTAHAAMPSATVTQVALRAPGEKRKEPWSLARLVRPLSLADTPGSTWLLGVVMGFLPCMIVMWALGLAATTRSVLDGAGIMITLVAMTTPVLLGVTLLPRLMPKGARVWLPAALMAVSGVWLVLVGLAGFSLVPHVHVAAGDYVVMLW
ncbi:MAG: sulfite exporter TauE/SafE family protein [Myxococcota bacterium]